MTQVALPFDPLPPEKLAYIVGRCCQHRPWFHDPLWEQGEVARRQAVLTRLADAWGAGRLWEVVHVEMRVTTGIILFDRLDYPIEAYGHFVFFDHELRNKRRLLLSVMDTMFEQVAVLRTEVPEYAGRLAGFLRKALGFRYEAEWLGVPPDDAKRVSRKFAGTRYQGRWQDVLLLSLTRDAFAAHLAAKGLVSEGDVNGRTTSDPPPSRPVGDGRPPTTAISATTS